VILSIHQIEEMLFSTLKEVLEKEIKSGKELGDNKIESAIKNVFKKH